MAMTVRKTAKLNQCDNIVSRSSSSLPAALMTLSDIPLDSRYVRRDLTFDQDAAQRNWTAATPVCCQIVRVERLAGLQPVALHSSRHSRTALVVKATTLAAGRIECRINLDIPTEAVVTVNPLIGAPRRRSAHLNFQQSP